MKRLLLAIVAFACCSTAQAQVDIWGINNSLQNAYNQGQGYVYQQPVYYAPRYYAPRYDYARSYGGYGYGRRGDFDAAMDQMETSQHLFNIEFQLQQINNQQQLDAMRMR